MKLEDFDLNKEEHIYNLLNKLKKQSQNHLNLSKDRDELKMENLETPSQQNSWSRILVYIEINLYEIEKQRNLLWNDIYKQYKQYGKKKDQEKIKGYLEKQEIKKLTDTDEEILNFDKKINLLKTLKKFVENILKQLNQKSFAINNYINFDKNNY